MKGFDPKQEAQHIIGWIRGWFEQNGPQANAVIGLSGGKDSTVAAKLLCEALGPQRVFGVLMPDGEQKDLADAKRVAALLGIRSAVVDICPATTALRGCVESGLADMIGGGNGPVSLSRDAGINLPPRVRMATLYGIAQSLPGGGRVANTCNLSEDHIGYSTKYGDAAGDFSPLSQYTVTEVRQIGRALGLPADLVDKTPSDGLCGMSDEERIGFSYETLDAYIKTGVCEDEAVRAKIDRMYAASRHKLLPMPFCPRQEEP